MSREALDTSKRYFHVVCGYDLYWWRDSAGQMVLRCDVCRLGSCVTVAEATDELEAAYKIGGSQAVCALLDSLPECEVP